MIPSPHIAPRIAPRILVVEDDRDVARLIAAQLRGDGFEVVVNSSGGGVVEQAAGLEPQLVILDLMLPLAHGFEILTELRQEPRFSQLPVLILTALGAESDRVRGLDLGADDYIPKPFSPLELSARVRARLRAAPAAPSALLVSGGLALDLKARTARCGDRVLELSDTEFRILAFLMRSPGQAFTRREIVAAVWSPQHFITDRAVDVYILRLRAKIETDPEQPQRLISVRRVGYRFDGPAE